MQSNCPNLMVGGDFIPASEPVLETRGDASLSEQHHLPSEPSTGSKDQPWGWFCKTGSPPKKTPKLG